MDKIARKQAVEISILNRLAGRWSSRIVTRAVYRDDDGRGAYAYWQGKKVFLRKDETGGVDWMGTHQY